MNIRTARDLGAAVRQTRTARGISQAALAKEVGVHQPKISAVERGAPGVRVGLVLQILHALQLTITVNAAAKAAATKGGRRKDGDSVDLDKIANTGLD